MAWSAKAGSVIPPTPITGAPTARLIFSARVGSILGPSSRRAHPQLTRPKRPLCSPQSERGVGRTFASHHGDAAAFTVAGTQTIEHEKPRPNPPPNLPDDLERKSGSGLEAAAVHVTPPIRQWGRKLIQQVAVGSMNLNSVEPRLPVPAEQPHQKAELDHESHPPPVPSGPRLNWPKPRGGATGPAGDRATSLALLNG